MDLESYFTSPALEQWQEGALKALRGKPLSTLSSSTLEGINLEPLYHHEGAGQPAHLGGLPGQEPFVRGAEPAGPRPWRLRSDLWEPKASRFVRQAREELSAGADSLGVCLDAAGRAGLDPDAKGAAGLVGQGGLSVACVADLAEALAGVDLGRVPVILEAGSSALPAGALLCAAAKENGVDGKDIQGALSLDPLGELAATGALPAPLPVMLDEMAALMTFCKERMPGVRPVVVRSLPYHNGGGSNLHELGFVLATAVEYLAAMTERGLTTDEAAASICFDFSLGTRLLMETAKLRAARLLWSQATVAFGVKDPRGRAMRIHARGSAWNKTARDPWVNILRSTVESFAAVTGAADSLSVAPFDQPLGLPGPRARRLCRGTQLLLREEAALSQITDPAGGSWCVEDLTEKLGQKSWALLQEVERQGGMAASLRAGFVQQEVASLAESRSRDVARAREPLVGVSRYALVGEQRLQREELDLEAIRFKRGEALKAWRAGRTAAAQQALERLQGARGGERVEAAVDAAAKGASLGELCEALRPDGKGEAVAPIPQSRAAQPFEALRDLADSQEARQGVRPWVFLLHLGEPSGHKRRADFVTGFFQVGGFDVQQSGGCDSLQQALDSLAPGAAAVVVCSGDERYQEVLPPLARAIKEAQPDRAVVLAGNPGELEATYRAAGVDAFIYQGADMVEILRPLLDRQGGEA